MAIAKKRRNAAKWGGGPFVAMPRDFLRSRTLASLSPFAAKLLLDMLAAYNGRNNGDLCCTWVLMQPRGWRSKSTLEKARRELLDKGVIQLTRQGGRRWPNFHALDLFWVDECKGKQLEVAPSGRPTNRWLLKEPAPSIAEARAAFKAKQQQTAAP